MKKIVILGLAMSVFVGCAGVNRMSASRKTDSQLKLRLSQLDRELSMVRWGPDQEHDTNMTIYERDAIERELLSRCEAGDREACLPQFGR